MPSCAPYVETLEVVFMALGYLYWVLWITSDNFPKSSHGRLIHLEKFINTNGMKQGMTNLLSWMSPTSLRSITRKRHLWTNYYPCIYAWTLSMKTILVLSKEYPYLLVRLTREGPVIHLHWLERNIHFGITIQFYILNNSTLIILKGEYKDIPRSPITWRLTWGRENHFYNFHRCLSYSIVQCKDL